MTSPSGSAQGSKSRFPWFTPPPSASPPAPAAAAAEPTGGAAAETEAMMRGFFDAGVMRQLERLQIVSLRMHGAASHGGRRSKKRGTSVEFADYREYTPGDDLRQIDWNIYGRSDRLFVKLREDEESLVVHLLVDCSKSMDWGRIQKLAYARQLAGALGYVGLASQDRVEAAGFNDRLISHLPPLRARAQVGHLFSFLAALQPGGSTDLKAALRTYASLHRRSGLVILISDLLNPGGLEGMTALLDRGFEAVLVHLLDPVETDPDVHGEVELLDRESGQTLRLSLDSGTLEAYRRRVAEWLQETEAFCAKRMIRYVTASTAMPLADFVFRQLRARKIVT